MHTLPTTSPTLPWALAAILLTTVAAAAGSVRAQGPPDPPLLARAKVGREDAQRVALARVPKGSTVRSAELEKEGGALRWTFDLNTPGSRRVTEVGVDARTGRVVEKRVESARDETREQREEAREVRGGNRK